MNGNQNLALKRPAIFECYSKFREFVLKGTGQVHDELLPVLYYFYIHLYYNFIQEEQLLRSMLPSLNEWKKDFIHINTYLKEISYLESIVQMPTDEKLKEDKFLQQIFSTNKTIVLSQYPYEVFQMFVRLNKSIDDALYQVQNAMKIEIQIAKDPDSQSNKMTNGIVSRIPFDDIKKMNDIKIKLAPLKDDAFFLAKLETLYESKKKNELAMNSKKMKDKLMSEPDLPGWSFLEKSDVPIPETKFKHKVDLVKAFLDKPALEDSEVNVLNISIKDPWENVTCVDIGKKGNILLVGFDNNRIMLVVLNQNFSDVNALEKSKKKHVEGLNKGLSLNAMEEEFAEPKGKEGKEGKPTKEEKKYENKYQTIDFVGHEDAVCSVSLSYDELYFISGSVDTTVRLWCVRQRTCLSVFRGHINTVWCVKFSPKGFYFASGSSDCTARLWNTDKHFAVKIFLGHNADVHVLDFIDNCNYLITSSYDKTIRIWEVSSARCCKILFHNNETVTALCPSFSGQYLITGSEDGLVILWDLMQNVKVNSFYLENGKRVNSISINQDGKYLIVSSKQRISYYDIERLKEEQGDLYEAVLKGEVRTEIVKNSNKNLVMNSYYTENIPDYDFLLTKFSHGNFVFLISRSFEE